MLSHLALPCQCLAYPDSAGDAQDLDGLLVSMGTVPVGAGGEPGDGRGVAGRAALPVLVDGMASREAIEGVMGGRM